MNVGMPQSVTFDFLLHAALREKENHFQLTGRKKKKNVGRHIRASCPAFCLLE
jgi:hypothetical protein